MSHICVHVACRMSRVACRMSHVACRVSHVACRMSHVACGCRKLYVVCGCCMYVESHTTGQMPRVFLLQRPGLLRRAHRLATGETQPPLAAMPPEPPTVMVGARALRQGSGGRVIYLPLDDEVSAACVVETLVLQVYAEAGGWRGVHTESVRNVTGAVLDRRLIGYSHLHADLSDTVTHV